MMTFVVLNLSKGLFGKSISIDFAYKISQTKNGNEVLLLAVHELNPNQIIIDDMGSVSYACKKMPKVEIFTGKYIDGELWQEK